jgi:hypothetical protein
VNLLVGEITGLLKILVGVAGGIVAATNSVLGGNADWDVIEAASSIGAAFTGVLVVMVAADGVAEMGVVGDGAMDEQLTPAPAKTSVFVKEIFASEGKLDEKVTSSGELTLSLEPVLPLIDNEDKDLEGDETREDDERSRCKA